MGNFQTLIKLRTNMKFSNVVEPITVNKPTDDFCLEISYIFSYSRFYWFCFNSYTLLQNKRGRWFRPPFPRSSENR